MAQPISNLSVGAKVKSVKTTYNGVPIIWLIGHKETGRVKLVTERIITLKCFDAKEPSNPNSDRANYGNNRYSQSNIDQWLNSAAGAGAWYSARHAYDAPPNNANVWSNYNEYDAQAGFLSFFEESFRNAILDSTIRVAKNTVTDGGGYEDITRKVYLLSRTEVGLGNENGIAEGSKWDLFSDDNSRKAYPTAEAVSASEYTDSSLNASSPLWWWLRTPNAGLSRNARGVNTGGTLSGNNAYEGVRGVRPALEVGSGILVSDTPGTDGAYILIWGPSINLTRFDLDKVNVIGKLGTTPQERGLTTQQFKDKFDEGPIALGEFVNETLIPEVEAHLVNETLIPEVEAHMADNTRHRRIILSDQDADSQQMQNGDIWIKYEIEE